MNNKSRFLIITLTLSLAACSGKKSAQVVALQESDKNLSCREIKLEMNEAEFYLKNAKRNKGMGITDIFTPIGYMSTYKSASKAEDSANDRIEYLAKIHDIMHCEIAPAEDMQQVVKKDEAKTQSKVASSKAPQPMGGGMPGYYPAPYPMGGYPAMGYAPYGYAPMGGYR